MEGGRHAAPGRIRKQWNEATIFTVVFDGRLMRKARSKEFRNRLVPDRSPSCLPNFLPSLFPSPDLPLQTYEVRFSEQIIGLAFFCVLWDGFLAVWYVAAIASGEIAMILFPILHLAVGAAITYVVVASFLNRTRIEVAPDGLTIRHGPVPWRGNRTIAPFDLEQLYTKERIHRGKRGTWNTYELWARVRGDPDAKLLSGLEDRDQALFIEGAVEERLRIADRAVEGEVPR